MIVLGVTEGGFLLPELLPALAVNMQRHKARECARRTPFSYSIFVGLVLCDGVQIRLNIAV